VEETPDPGPFMAGEVVEGEKEDPITGLGEDPDLSDQSGQLVTGDAEVPGPTPKGDEK
jgi:hypothetical protein